MAGLRDTNCDVKSKLTSVTPHQCNSNIDSDGSDELPELVPDGSQETVPETSTQSPRIAPTSRTRLSFWSLLKKHKKKNNTRSSRDVTMQESSSSPTESSDEGSSEPSRGGFWSVVKKHLMKSPEPPPGANISGVVHDPITAEPDHETLLGATALPLSPSETEPQTIHSLEEDAEMTDDLFENENLLPQHDRRQRRGSGLSVTDPIQLGLDIAQEFITPISPPRPRTTGPFGFPFSSPLDSTSTPFGNLGSRSREFGTAFSSGDRPSPLDILSQVLRGHLGNFSQGSSREPDSDSPPLSESPDSLPGLIPNVQPGEVDSSSDDSRSREFGTAFSSGARPSPLDILTQVLRGHLGNSSHSSSRTNREPDSESSPPFSETPESLPELIPNVRPGEAADSSSEDTFVPLSSPLGETQPTDESQTGNPPELNSSNTNTESSMAVPLLPGLIYIVVSVDDASLAGLHLLSQLDNSGPPPLSDAKIEQIPTKIITKEQCDTGLQCSICMEEFCIQQSVRVLCCDHCFHNDCIRPWLELHGTCPVCRKTLTNSEDEADSELQNSSNNILNGASGLAARLSGAVSASSSSASSSSSLSNASSESNRSRPTITMFII